MMAHMLEDCSEKPILYNEKAGLAILYHFCCQLSILLPSIPGEINPLISLNCLSEPGMDRKDTLLL